MIQDSGKRREFETGAVRDIQEGKGRCDLIPMDVMAYCMGNFPFKHIKDFQDTRNTKYLIDLLQVVKDKMFDKSWETMFLELAIHFEDGAKKYGDRNWQKGIPVDCYIDSAIRHYLKWKRGDADEHHNRAFVWNIVCCIWTVEYCATPEMQDIPSRMETEDKHETD